MVHRQAPGRCKRRGGTRGKVVGGGLIVAALLFIGSWLGGKGLFPGGGGGPGTGDGEKRSNVNTVANTDPKENTRPPEKVEPEVGSVVNVLIDGEKYLLLKSPDADWGEGSNYTEVPLERIVEEAQQAEGESGVKVRVARRGTAVPQAEQRLEEALEDVGVAANAVEWREGEVP